MNNIATLTSKKVQIYIKNGFTPEQIMEKHDCSKPELKEQLRKLYRKGNGTKAQSVYGLLEANRKKPHSLKGPKNVEVIDASNQIVVKDEQAETSEGVEPKDKTLADLLEEEKSLSDALIALESDHKALSEQHRACIDELRELQKKIKTIRDALEDCRCRFETTATKADEIATRMNEVSTIVRPKRAALEKVRQEIIDAKTITICVSNDGTIEAPDNPEFVVNDEGFQSLKAEISEREECLDLRIRDIATLARLIKICEKVEHFSLICDNAELEKTFWAIR